MQKKKLNKKKSLIPTKIMLKATYATPAKKKFFDVINFNLLPD